MHRGHELDEILEQPGTFICKAVDWAGGICSYGENSALCRVAHPTRGVVAGLSFIQTHTRKRYEVNHARCHLMLAKCQRFIEARTWKIGCRKGAQSVMSRPHCCFRLVPLKFGATRNVFAGGFSKSSTSVNVCGVNSQPIIDRKTKAHDYGGKKLSGNERSNSRIHKHAPSLFCMVSPSSLSHLHTQRHRAFHVRYSATVQLPGAPLAVALHSTGNSWVVGAAPASLTARS